MKFETPYVEVKKFDVMDVLTASTPEETEAPCPLNNDLPCDD